MPVLTDRREKQTGPVISALVAAVLLLGIACALPAFASTDSANTATSGLIGLCPPSATATGTASTGPTDGGPTATSTDTSGPTSPGTPSGTATPTATGTGCVASAPPASNNPTKTTAPTAPPSTVTGPPTTVAPTVPPVVEPTEPGSTFTYTDTPPGNTTVQLPHGTITRAQIISRAETWLAEKVPYSQTEWWTDANGTYRQDCSGYVSMAWDLNQNIDFWTGNLNTVSHTIDPSQLLPGDNLMSVEHTIIFAGWANAAHTTFNFYEEAHPGTFARYVVDAPLTDYTDQGFAAFRYDGVIDSSSLPSNPATGLDYSALAAGQSEIVPAGVSTTMPAPAPWQRTLPNEGSLASKTPTPAVRPELAADALPEPAGPAPVRVLLSAAILAAFAVGLVFARRPRLKVYRRRH